LIYRSKAPLRISLAGGGTDLAEYSEIYGGGVLNSTINLYAHASIRPRREGIVLRSADHGLAVESEATAKLDIDGTFDLAKGVYNRIVREFNYSAPLAFEMLTFVDAAPGSGLGSSSTLVVAMIGAFAEWLKLPLCEYDIAHLAYDIERSELGFAGGHQDQYAATFGGWNFMEFSAGDKVIVNPLRIRQAYLQELEFNIVLYYTGTSRLSSTIIEGQIANLTSAAPASVEAMHRLKEQAFMMKEALLTGQLNRMGELLDYGWRYKRDTASDVSTDQIDRIYARAISAGATGGKISGAGGGGYMMFYCPGNTRYTVIEALHDFGGEVHRLHFCNDGLTTWEVK
jgi:D-glycero-alpha-D-manno-heptose-7-phosphate kinase